MGTSIAMIDLHYGHLAVDRYQRAVSLTVRYCRQLAASVY